jgi:dihydroxyacid dehydratase/phosphogluconate dehydratase
VQYAVNYVAEVLMCLFVSSYSANTMGTALEVLGLSLPYSASTPATFPGERLSN